jgi:hypothetical protein
MADEPAPIVARPCPELADRHAHAGDGQSHGDDDGRRVAIAGRGQRRGQPDGEADHPDDAADGGHEGEDALVHGGLLVGGTLAADLRVQAGVEGTADEVELVED